MTAESVLMSAPTCPPLLRYWTCQTTKLSIIDCCYKSLVFQLCKDAAVFRLRNVHYPVICTMYT